MNSATQSQTSKTCVVDVDDNLEIHCSEVAGYFASEDQSAIFPPHRDLQEEDDARKIRGMVVEKRTSKVIAKGGFFAYEYTPADVEKLNRNLDFFNRSFDDMTVAYSVEGTIIRVFYYQNKWYVSTHRKLDAARSKWGSTVSFRQLFENALLEHYGLSIKDLCLTLNLRCEYSFMIMADNNTKFACTPFGRKCVYFLSSDDPKDATVKVDRLPCAPDSIQSLEQAFQCVEAMTYPFAYQGILLTHTPSGAQYRIVSCEYLRLYGIRNNQQSIPFRYIQLRKELADESSPTWSEAHSAEDKLMWLKKLFPEFENTFLAYERHFETIASNLYRHFSDLTQNRISPIAQSYYLFIKNNKAVLSQLTEPKQFLELVFREPAPVINNMLKLAKMDANNKSTIEVEKTPAVEAKEETTDKKKIKYRPAPLDFIQYYSASHRSSCIKEPTTIVKKRQPLPKKHMFGPLV